MTTQTTFHRLCFRVEVYLTLPHPPNFDALPGQKASAEQAIDLSKSMDLVSFTEFLVGSTEAIEPIERRVRQGERTSTILQ